MKIFRKLFLLAVSFSIVFSSCSQQSDKPFYEEIQNFKAADKQNPPPKDAIVFVGSSSFAMWTDVQDYFPGYKIIQNCYIHIQFHRSAVSKDPKYIHRCLMP